MKRHTHTATLKPIASRATKSKQGGSRGLTHSPAFSRELKHFIEYHPAKRLSRNLRTMLIDFLLFEGATESSYLEDLLYDLQGLFELLEAIQAEENPETV